MAKTGKNLFNTIDNAVQESLTGLSLVYPHLELHASKRVVLAPNYKDRVGKVACISGGGSGHEPFAAGFVGSGMLTASVAGGIFAAPPSRNIFHAIKCVSANNKAGVFVASPNYTGDCLNFGIAIEKAKLEGIPVEQIFMGEDCSIPENERGRAGKRGLSGMIFILKIAGSLAENGSSLEEISSLSKIVLANMATYGVALTACQIPGQGLMFDMPMDEIEFGLGIHGEAGYKRVKLTSAAEVVSQILDQVTSAVKASPGDSVAVIVNNFGGLSKLEEGIVAQDVVTQLQKRKIKPVRVYAGSLVTSLDSTGVHITLLKLPKEQEKLILRCLDDKTEAPAWPGCSYSLPLLQARDPFKEEARETIAKSGRVLTDSQQRLIKECLKNACKVMKEKESKINDLDRGVGDADCGTSHRVFADGIMTSLERLPLSHPTTLLLEMALIAEQTMGGTSGALYSLLFTTASKEIGASKADDPWPNTWARAWRGGINGMMKYSQAQLGDRTMLDALDPACTVLESNSTKPMKEVAPMVAEAAWKGCNATKDMVPKAGRASYVRRAEFLQNEDAGAHAVATLVDVIFETIQNYQPLE